MALAKEAVGPVLHAGNGKTHATAFAHNFWASTPKFQPMHSTPSFTFSYEKHELWGEKLEEWVLFC